MAGEELQVIRLRNDFYRDGFTKVLLALGIVSVAIILLIAASIYLVVAKPSPVAFSTDNEWRVVPPVPLDQPYLSTADLTQWVSLTLPNVFNYDFLHYMAKYKDNQQYFTQNGFNKYIGILNLYAPYNLVSQKKLFVSAAPDGAPFIVNQGLIGGRYSWWLQMPLVIHFGGLERGYSQNVTLQVLVVREPTLNNLSGVVIDNMVIPQQKPAAPEQGQTPAAGDMPVDGQVPAQVEPIIVEQVGANG